MCPHVSQERLIPTVEFSLGCLSNRLKKSCDFIIRIEAMFSVAIYILGISETTDWV